MAQITEAIIRQVYHIGKISPLNCTKINNQFSILDKKNKGS